MELKPWMDAEFTLSFHYPFIVLMAGQNFEDLTTSTAAGWLAMAEL
jgi:hypothetical protein